MFYWITIMFSQTLGTALGDWTADSGGMGYSGAAAIFGGLLALLVLAYYGTKISRTLLFWAAFILTRPLGAVVGDFLETFECGRPGSEPLRCIHRVAGVHAVRHAAVPAESGNGITLTPFQWRRNASTAGRR